MSNGNDIPLNFGRPRGPMMPNGVNAAVVVEVLDPVTKPNRFYNPNDANNSKKDTTQSQVIFKNAGGGEAEAYYSLSLHPKSNLFKHVTGVTGGTVPPELKTLRGQWPAGLMGMQCQLLIGVKPSTTGGQPKQGAILAVMPPAPGQHVVPPAAPVSNQPPANAAPGVHPVQAQQQPVNPAIPPANSPVGF